MADANPLAPLALLATLGRVLAVGAPTSSSGSSSRAPAPTSSSSTSTSPSSSAAHDAPLLASPADLAVATCHAALTALGFRFLGIGEDTPRSAPAASHASNTNTNSDSTDDSSDAARLPPAWNATGDTYSLRYAHPQSSFTFLLKAVRLASKLILHAMSIQAAVVHDLALDVSSLADASSFPIRRSSLAAASTNASNATTDASTNTSTNTSTDAADWWAPHPLGRAFLSKDRLEEFVYQFKTRIVQQLIPGLNKPGYEESRPLPSATASTAASTSAQPQPSGSLRDPARGGRAPDWEPSGVPFPGQGGGGGRASGAPFAPSPYGVGDVDLDPFAAAPGLILPGRGGMYPGGGGGMHPGGGMFVGPDHPMFGGPGGGGPFAPPMGGPLRLPHGAVPPGARFDPITPFGPRPGGRGGFGGGPSRGGFGPNVPGFGRGHPANPNPFSGDPDNDELPPPGMYM